MKVGFAVNDITPRIGVQMYGFGPFLNRTANRIHDRIEARAAAFESQDGSRALIVSCDLGSLSANLCNIVRKVVADNVPRLPENRIMVECIHTHSAPATAEEERGWGFGDKPYLESLPWRIAKAGIDAFNNLEEGTLSAAVVPCEQIGLNRCYEGGAPDVSIVTAPDWHPKKPELTDTVCRVVRFDNAQGTLKGFWAYFGCHPVVCCKLTHAIHGDYAGGAIHKVMAEYPGTVGLFLQGANGDVNSACVHKPEDQSFAALPVFVERFAKAVRLGLKEARPIAAEPLKVASRIFRFSTKESFTKEYLLEQKAELEAKLHRWDVDEASNDTRMSMVYLLGVRKMLANLDKKTEPGVPVEVQAIRVGDWEMLGAGFEIMQAIKNDVFAAAKARFPMVMSLCNDAAGYAPDNTQLARADTYEALKVPLIQGRPAYSNIHNELVNAMLDLDGELN